MEDEGGKIRRQEISGHATNQTFLHIDHAQSMLVRLQFRYPSPIKLLSTRPSCLNVRLTSVIKKFDFLKLFLHLNSEV